MASLPLDATEEQRLEHFRALGRRYPIPYPRTFDDLRINPYLEKYDPNVAYRAFTNIMLADSTTDDFSDDQRHKTILKLLYSWRKAYLDPEDPVCDHCAAFSIRGQRGRAEGWPRYSRENTTARCDTSGNGTCKPCFDEGVRCETMGVFARDQAVGDYVRGRQWWWFEGVGKVHCDGCLAADYCDVWQDDGCTACKTKKVPCTVRGHVPGSFQERMSRRNGLEDDILQVKREVPDKMPDLRYLHFLASNKAQAPGRIPKDLVPYCEGPPAGSALSSGSGYFASIEVARQALLQAGVTVEPLPTGHSTFLTYYNGCNRCARFRHKCIGKDSQDPNSPCVRCTNQGFTCVRRLVPAQGEAARFSIQVEVGHWDSAQRAPNGRYLIQEEEEVDGDFQMEDAF